MEYMYNINYTYTNIHNDMLCNLLTVINFELSCIFIGYSYMMHNVIYYILHNDSYIIRP